MSRALTSLTSPLITASVAFLYSLDSALNTSNSALVSASSALLAGNILLTWLNHPLVTLS